MKFKNNKNITPALHTYIESQILPQYSAFDPAHQRNHVDAVIRESMHLATHFEIDANMVYTIAAYHDLGIGTDRKTHHLISGNIIRQDIELSKWFNKEQIETMAQAVEDHRASNKSEPRSVYGKIVAEADRQLDTRTIIERTILYGWSHYPELKKQAQLERACEHLQKKYGEGGYLKLWIPQSENQQRLIELRRILKNKEELLHILEQTYQALANMQKTGKQH